MMMINDKSADSKVTKDAKGETGSEFKSDIIQWVNVMLNLNIFYFMLQIDQARHTVTDSKVCWEVDKNYFRE